VAVSSDDFRAALRRFATGVTVVTVAAPDGPHGMTASSFASVSLDPPLVLVCLGRSSRTRHLLSETNFFVVNVLAAHQEHISRAFARQGVKPFDKLPHRLTQDGAPVLDGVIAWMECSVEQIVQAGDHDVVVGRVARSSATDEEPLVYFDQRYRELTRDQSSETTSSPR
jgi:flavin reductase (DIM6/NTAB) family NADH-FMN oxidoreductase RutF